MTRNREVQLNDSGPAVASLSGRGDLYATLRPAGPGKVLLRIDDADRPEFWAEVAIDLKAAENALRDSLEAEEYEDAGPLIEVICLCCGRPTGSPDRDFCGACSPPCER